MRKLPPILTLALLPLLSEARELSMPAVPDSLRVPEQRASFLSRHFWQNMDWRDAEAVADAGFMEQNLSNFFAISGIASEEARREGVATLLRESAVSPAATRSIAGLAYTYLYSIQSPFFDEETYLLFADGLSTPEGGRANLDEAELIRLVSRRREIMKNRVGEAATDFRFIDREGATRSLSEVPGRRLVIFYDNDCEQCDRLKRALVSSARLQAEIDGGALTVLAVEAYGVDEGEWAAKAEALPACWSVGRSPEGEIDGDELYVLLTAPTVYIIDAQGRVEAKNIAPERLEEALGFRF